MTMPFAQCSQLPEQPTTNDEEIVDIVERWWQRRFIVVFKDDDEPLISPYLMRLTLNVLNGDTSGRSERGDLFPNTFDVSHLNKATRTLSRRTLAIARNIMAKTKATAEYASLPSAERERHKSIATVTSLHVNHYRSDQLVRRFSKYHS